MISNVEAGAFFNGTPERKGVDTGRPAGTQSDRADCVIIVVTYNSERSITGLLESVADAAREREVRTIVVDNASADATVATVRAYRDVLCLEAGGNLGYAAAINVGRQHAGEFEALLILNPDLVLAPNAISELLSVLGDPKVGLVVPRLVNSGGELYFSLRREPTLARAIGDALFGDHFPGRPGWLSEIVRDQREYSSRHSADWATGAAMLVTRKCDLVLGSWDEDFFLYSEEVDYAARARKAGFGVEYLPSAEVRHDGGGSGQSQDLAALMAVNRVRYRRKHHRGFRLYWAVVILHELIRSKKAVHRKALRAVMRPSRWQSLVKRISSPQS